MNGSSLADWVGAAYRDAVASGFVPGRFAATRRVERLALLGRLVVRSQAARRASAGTWLVVLPHPRPPLPGGRGEQGFWRRGALCWGLAAGLVGVVRCCCEALLQWGVDLLGRKGR